MKTVTRGCVFIRRTLPRYGVKVATKVSVSVVPVTFYDTVVQHQNVNIPKVIFDSVSIEVISGLTAPVQLALFSQSKDTLTLLAQELMKMKGLL